MYDPLIDRVTAEGQPYPASYWSDSVAETPRFASLIAEKRYDVVIIGAGFTGLSCAHYLQHQSELNVAVIDANQPGWGCSGRNAGFILPGSGRLDYASLCRQYGEQSALHTIDEYYQALDTIADLINWSGAQCDVSSGGYLKIGHSQKAFEALKRGSERLPLAYRDQYQVLSAAEIQSHFIPDYPSYGGVYRAAGQSLNPLKLSLALAEKLKNSVDIFADAAITRIAKEDNHYRLETQEGQLNADKVILASNAYSLKSLLPGLTEKQFPVLSSVLVTSPLPDTIAQKWKANLMAMDTRSLKYYFRLLNDNRILFGGRGAITGGNADTQHSKTQLKAAFDRYFPALKDLTCEWFWSGWVSVSADDIPHVLESELYPNLYYATGYCGSGLGYSCQAGKRLADMLKNPEAVPDSPVYRKAIPAFPMSPFRRTGLAIFYAWQRMMERLTMK